MGIKDKLTKLFGNEKNTDQVLDKAEALATEKLGADKADQIKKVRNAIDDKVGDQPGDAPAEGNAN